MLPWAGAATAQSLPFVEPGGVIRAELRYSHIVALIGERPRPRQHGSPGHPNPHGGIVFG